MSCLFYLSLIVLLHSEFSVTITKLDGLFSSWHFGLSHFGAKILTPGYFVPESFWRRYSQAAVRLAVMSLIATYFRVNIQRAIFLSPAFLVSIILTEFLLLPIFFWLLFLTFCVLSLLGWFAIFYNIIIILMSHHFKY